MNVDTHYPTFDAYVSATAAQARVERTVLQARVERSVLELLEFEYRVLQFKLTALRLTKYMYHCI